MRYLVDIDPRIRYNELADSFDLPVHVTFNGDFKEETAAKFRVDLFGAESHAKSIGQTIIPLVIDSYGGDVYALLSMIDTIRACSIPVATIVEGKAMSCGAVLFSCGKEGHRYMGPNATVMIHDVSSWSQGKCEEVVADASEVQRLNQLVYQLMAKNCGHKDFNHFYDEISRRRGADWYLTAEECMSHKLANHTYIPSMKVKARLEWKFE